MHAKPSFILSVFVYFFILLLLISSVLFVLMANLEVLSEICSLSLLRSEYIAQLWSIRLKFKFSAIDTIWDILIPPPTN